MSTSSRYALQKSRCHSQSVHELRSPGRKQFGLKRMGDLFSVRRPSLNCFNVPTKLNCCDTVFFPQLRNQGCGDVTRSACLHCRVFLSRSIEQKENIGRIVANSSDFLR